MSSDEVNGLAIDVQGAVVEAAWPSGVAIVARDGRSVILDGTREEIEAVVAGLAALLARGVL